MTDHERFKACLELARDIVASYRAECPVGVDPKATWAFIGVAAVGTVASVGTQMYSANQQKKAGQAQANAIGNMKELEPVLLGDPKQIDLRRLQGQAIDVPYDNLEYASRLSAAINRTNFREAIKYYRRIQPAFDAIQRQVGTNALSFARGELPSDVEDEILRTGAERGIQAGFGFGSQGGRTGALANLNLRNLGLTSLDLSKYGTNLGIQVNQSAKSLLPNLTSPLDFLFTPSQFLSAETSNVGSQNQFLLRNNELLNNAAMQNTSLANSQTQALGQIEANQAISDAEAAAGITRSVTSGLFNIASAIPTGGTTAAAAQPDWRINTPVYRPSNATPFRTGGIV